VRNIKSPDRNRIPSASEVRSGRSGRSAGYFKQEIIPIILAQKKGQIIFDTDEHPRETTLEKLAALSPVFKKDGTVTAGPLPGGTTGRPQS